MADEARQRDVAGQVLCAHVGQWRWDQQTEKARERWRTIAADVVGAYEAAADPDGDPEFYLPTMRGLGIGISYGGAAAPDAV